VIASKPGSSSHYIDLKQPYIWLMKLRTSFTASGCRIMSTLAPAISKLTAVTASMRMFGLPDLMGHIADYGTLQLVVFLSKGGHHDPLHN
jgi:hypothetical protein